jgi:hypothetical protein
VSTRERTEKVRQQLMRLNELLGQMRGRLAEGERAYQVLFASIAKEETDGLNHKEVQWKVAERLDDLTPLSETVGMLRFSSREQEKAFAELHEIIERTASAMD